MRARTRPPTLLFVALALLALGRASSAQAQSVDVTMRTSAETVAAGQRLLLEVRVDVEGGQAEEIEMPALDAFEVLSQQTSRPMSFSFGFGTGRGTTSSIKSSLTQRITLRALQPGRHTIAPARTRVNGKYFASQPVTIEVTGSAVAPSTAAPSPGFGPADPGLGADPTVPPPDGGLDGAEYDDKVFLRTVVDKPEAYVGEQVTVTVYLYSRTRTDPNTQVTREPTTEGFWVQDLLPMRRRVQTSIVNVRGRRFRTLVLRQFAAFPLRAGTLTIGAPRADLNQAQSVFSLFGGGRPSGPLTRDGVPVEVTVKPLPSSGRPTGEVHVGQLQLEVKAEPADAKVGDAITIEARLQGEGNLKNLRLPDPTIQGMEVLKPEVQDEVSTAGGRVSGTRTVRWLALAREPGRKQLSPFTVDSFDPDTGQYRRLKSRTIALNVRGQAAGTADASGTTTGGDPNANGGNNQRSRFGPVRVESELERATAPVHDSSWYWLLMAAGPLLLLGQASLRSGRRRLAGRAQGQAPARAMKAAHAQLDTASRHASGGDAQACFAEIAASLKAALESRLQAPVGGLTFGALRDRLTAAGMAGPMAERLVHELETCDAARFNPAGSDASQLADAVGRARRLLQELEGFEPLEVGP